MNVMAEGSKCKVLSVTYDVSDIVYVRNSSSNIFPINLTQ